MPVKLGTVDLDNVLSWEEEDRVTVPIRKIIRKTTPTVQTEYYVRHPKKIIIRARMTAVEKLQIRNLKNQNCWQPLCDFWATGTCNSANSEFIDYVWVEKLEHDWRGDKDHTYKWLSTITLICSQT